MSSTPQNPLNFGVEVAEALLCTTTGRRQLSTRTPIFRARLVLETGRGATFGGKGNHLVQAGCSKSLVASQDQQNELSLEKRVRAREKEREIEIELCYPKMLPHRCGKKNENRSTWRAVMPRPMTGSTSQQLEHQPGDDALRERDRERARDRFVCVYICIYVYMYMCICIYVYMYICIYVYMYIHITNMCIYIYI